MIFWKQKNAFKIEQGQRRAHRTPIQQQNYLNYSLFSTNQIDVSKKVVVSTESCSRDDINDQGTKNCTIVPSNYFKNRLLETTKRNRLLETIKRNMGLCQRGKTLPAASNRHWRRFL